MAGATARQGSSGPPTTGRRVGSLVAGLGVAALAAGPATTSATRRNVELLFVATPAVATDQSTTLGVYRSGIPALDAVPERARRPMAQARSLAPQHSGGGQ